VLVPLSVMWILWFLYHPFNKKTKVAFHLSEGTYDYAPPIIAVGLCKHYVCSSLIYPVSTWAISMAGDVPCTQDPSVLAYRYLIGLPITGILLRNTRNTEPLPAFFYFGSRLVLPSLLEPVFKFFKVDCHYIPYSKFREYIIENLKVCATRAASSL
jgi:hypothetical protein